MGSRSIHLIEEDLDLLRTQLITQRLQLVRLLAGQEAVVQRFEGDPGLAQLLFGPFMPVQIDFDGIRHIATDLDKGWTKICILQIEIIVVDAHRLPRPLESQAKYSPIELSYLFGTLTQNKYQKRK
jgi:hypothetical protein